MGVREQFNDHDGAGRLVSRQEADGGRTDYAYDVCGNPTAVMTTRSYYEYDLCGRLKGIRDKAGEEIVSYRHTPGGRLAGVRHKNGIKTSYEYDTDGNIIHLRTERKDGEVLLDFAYEYDGNGNRTAKTGGFQRLGEDGTYRIEEIRKDYRYDVRNRLTEEATKTEVETGGKEVSGITYRYDPCGNRLEKVEDGQWTGYCYNNKNQLTSRETKEGIWTYQYDCQGNLTEETGTDGNWEYHYDPLNRQEMIRKPDGSKIRNLYDGEGLRAEKQVNGKSSRFLFLNGEILAEMDESQKPVSHYVRGYGVATFGSGEEYNVVHQDESGSTVYVTGSGQEIHNSYEYDAFGVVTRRSEVVLNQILYTGQQYDQESGQYYLRARFYNPLIGRFLQEDVYRGDGLNLYAYCENNPVVYYDPSGYNKTQKPNSENSQGPNATEEMTYNKSGKYSAFGEMSEDDGAKYNLFWEQVASGEPRWGERPNPEMLLSSSEINEHLAQFENGASYLVTERTYEAFIEDAIGHPTLGRPGELFVTTSEQIDTLLKNANGDYRVIEKALGFDEGTFSKGGGLVRINISEPYNYELRLPSGNEYGANNHFIFGGKTDGGFPEAVVSDVPNADFARIVTHINFDK